MPGTWSPRRRYAWLAVTVVIAAVCVRLGIWQLDRLRERRAFNASVRTGLASPPAPLAAVVPAGEPVDAESIAFRLVETAGAYDLPNEVVLYGRTSNGRPGNHLLTPLSLPDGRTLLVDRGWVPLDTERSALAPPKGSVLVTGALVPSEEGGTVDAADRTITRINLPTIADLLRTRLLPVYLLLQDQTPSTGGGLPVPAPLPELSEGPHLSYAIQWFAFATVALVGYGLLDRRSRREAAPEDGGEP